jgi:chromosome segregation ATPase
MTDEQLTQFFTKLDTRFASIDERFASIDARFAAMDARFESLVKLIEDNSQSLQREMRDGFFGMNKRLDRIEAKLALHGRQIAAGARSIAGLTEWTDKADKDYVRVLAELALLKSRLDRIEDERSQS